MADNGAGVPAHLRARIFEPFFTTKPEGMGTGVGLSVSRSVARENGGELRLEEPAHGASFHLWLPLDHEAAQPAPSREAPLPDDERLGHALMSPKWRSSWQTSCDRRDHATRLGSGREALQWLATGHCDFLLSDIRMAGSG